MLSRKGHMKQSNQSHLLYWTLYSEGQGNYAFWSGKVREGQGILSVTQSGKPEIWPLWKISL